MTGSGRLGTLISRLLGRAHPQPDHGQARFSAVGSGKYPAEPRTPPSPEHLRLLRACESRNPTSWSEIALCACLARLSVSTITEAHAVEVVGGEVEGPDAFRIVFTTPYVDVRVGVRGSTSSPLDPGVFPYPLGAGAVQDPAAYGRNLADFAIGEPFGMDSLNPMPDDEGIHWLVV